MKFWKFAQAGNEEQCQDNSIEGWEYSFGFRSQGSVYGTSYSFCNKDGDRTGWFLEEEYATSFQLILTF